MGVDRHGTAGDRTASDGGPADGVPDPDRVAQGELPTDARPDTPRDVPADPGAEGPADAAPDLAQDLLPDTPSDPGAEGPTDAAPDLAQDLLPDTPADTAPDLVPDVPPDLPSVPPEAWWPLGEVVQVCAGGFRAVADSPSGPVQLLVLRGTHWEMGYQHGCLGGPGLAQFWQQFVAYFLEEIQGPAAEIGVSPETLELVLINLLGSTWEHVAPFVSEDFEDEIQGFAQGAGDAGVVIPGWSLELAVRGLILLANVSDLDFSGSLEAVVGKISSGYSPALLGYYDEADAGALRELLRRGPEVTRLPPAFATSCSFFGAWGPRTQGGHYVGSRNLDWSTDTGIQGLRALTFYAPEGGHAHLAIGYAGFPGALAGLSARGVVVSEVGSKSVMERLKGQPWVLKFREILEHADDLDEALELGLGLEPGGPPRPVTIGYNFAVGWGDPDGVGASAGGLVLETNGLAAGIYRHGPGCGVEASLVRYDLSGAPVETLGASPGPSLVNAEADAVEVDATGQPRLFQVDAEGAHVLDGNGWPIPDPEGAPYPVGRPLPCAFFRGDEALMHGIRRWQTASNGPQVSQGLLVQSGSYRHRYARMSAALAAAGEGVAFALDGQEVIPDNGGVPLALDLELGERVARAAAMGSNVLSVAWDATALTLRVSWESGSGATWENAVKHDYWPVDAGALFKLLEENAP